MKLTEQEKKLLELANNLELTGNGLINRQYKIGEKETKERAGKDMKHAAELIRTILKEESK